MDNKEMLLKRYSCRKFTEEKVKEEDLNLIIKAGLNAPCGKNRQDSKLVVVEDESLVKKLSDLNATVLNSNTDPFYGAKTIVCVFVKSDSPTLVQDGSAILTMMQSQAFMLNIGSCWINRLKEMMVSQEGLALMEQWGIQDYTGVGICILGIPYGQGKAKEIKANRVINIR